MLTFSLRELGGEYTQEEYDRKIKSNVSFFKSEMLQDPQVAQFIAATELVGDNMILLPNRQEVMNKIANMYNSNSDPTVPSANPYDSSSDGRKAIKSYTELLQQSSDKLSPEAQVDQKQQLEGLFKGIVSYESFLAEAPENAISLVTDWMSTQEFYNFRTTNPESFPDTSAASRVLQTHYGDEVWGMIRREFRDAEIVSPGEVTMQPGVFGPRPTQGPDVKTPVPDAVTYRSTSGGMEFFAINPQDQQAVVKAGKLNKELAPIINKNIKAFAHLDGSNDYRSYWENVDESFITGVEGSDQLDGGDGGDDLTLEDFKVGDAQLTAAMSEGGFVGDGDFSNADTPEEVAAAFVGFNEVEHEDVLSSFIEKTFGKNLSPSETAWCAAFVNGALGAVGVEGTGTLTAKDFLGWGSEVKTPQQGDIAVFDRGAPGSWQGHVGFYVGPSEKEGHVRILGGNQNDKVSIKDTPTDRLIGYRRGK